MEGFLNWFFAFMTVMLGGIWQIISNFFLGFVQIFNFPMYIQQLNTFKNEFTVVDWILSILCFILTFAVWATLLFLVIVVIRKYIRFRKTLVGNEDLLEEIADLHRDVLRLTAEKERIMAMKIAQTGLSPADMANIFDNEDGSEEHEDKPEVIDDGKRFFRLSAVDDKYEFYTPPVYDTSMNLEQLCDDLRNFACVRQGLFYEIKTIRLMIAGLSSTKLILLQGISGTGKTSLPYVMGKYFLNDTTIASVQPSWRDRTELFGYFNEFTKKFNETEVLRRIYEATYTDDINIIVLDEMNIARVEYYFAEMLSMLEMPDPSEWKIELVPSSWETDPKHLPGGKLQIPQNVWYIGTANNDDSTFAVSDKVYDRALVINLDKKGVPFEAPDTEPKMVPYSHVEALYKQAVLDYPVSQELLDKIGLLDIYVIEHFRVAFGNRIMKQLNIFVPVYVACGGNDVEAIDYILATKVIRKFESLNLSLIRDEIKGLIRYLDTLFGKGRMVECRAYLERLQKMY
jgi:hypothetical protein